MLQYSILLLLFVGGLAFPAINDEGIGFEDDTTIFFDHSGFNRGGRIVGGSIASEGSYPWMAAVTVESFTRIFICGGAIITNRHVLTAAHCVDAIIGRFSPRVVVGTNRWQNDEAQHGMRILARNPAYDVATRKNDIGIIGTTTDIAFNSRVRAIGISNEFVPGGILVRISGWGWTKAGGTISDDLQELRLLTLDGASCDAEVRRVADDLGMHVPRVNPDLEICTFLMGTEGICVGDGGSPLVHNSNNIVIGVASWGVPCARGAPDVFTRVSAHQAWIQTVLSFDI